MRYAASAYICGVCNSPYLSRPPAVRSVRGNLLKRGTLLVSRDTVGPTFQHTVILLLNDVCGSGNNDHHPHGGGGGGVFGVIVNAPLKEELIPNRNLVLVQSQQQQQESSGDNADNNNNNHNNPLKIEWRRGGPVCGGRLGVVHYTVLHTFPPTLEAGSQDGILDVDIDEEYFDEDENDEVQDLDDDDDEAVTENNIAAASDYDDDDVRDNNAVRETQRELPDINGLAESAGDDDEEEDDDEDENQQDDGGDENDTCVPLSLPVFDVTRNEPPLQFVASPNSQMMPSTFSEDKLGQTLQRLALCHSNNSTTMTTTSNRNDDEATTVTNTTSHNRNNDDHDHDEVDTADNTTGNNQRNDNNNSMVILFSGYCKWRAGQLEREIQREVWNVCVDATPEDIVRHPDSGLWEEISESNRLLSWQRLIEEDE